MKILHILFLREVLEGDIALSDITKGFSDGAKRVITAALTSAKELGHTYVGSEHILLGILKERESTSSKLLTERGLDIDLVKKKIIGLVGMGCKTILTADDMTPISRRIILRASIIAGSTDSSKIRADHILMAMLGEECVAVRIMEESGIDTEEIYIILEELYLPDESSCNSCGIFGETLDCRKKNNFPTPLLDANATDLTEKASRGGVDPVVGREKEEERLIAVLLRRSKNNPCLVGEAGVGKTAIVESVASRIVQGRVPDELKNKRILSLELAMVVAGTKYRGEFEEKIKNILAEVRGAGDIILFIDEIHTVVGAGGAEGAIDASNILKPALARGEIRIIGATTLAEFRESIEKDKALERRFQPITVEEPNEDTCIKMLEGLRKRYEAYHNVTITEKALRAAVFLSKRYIPERYLPDKAIDLIDESAAMLKIDMGNSEKILDEETVAVATEIRTGIPVKSLTRQENDKLRYLESELKRHIIGQDEAVDKLAKAVCRARLGVNEGKRPNASFLFLGKSGVGKTECAKILAKTIFTTDNAFIKLDMSEFSESHSVAKLIGAPPGYLGHGDVGTLTERVRRNPYSLVLFDEIEKAHPDVCNLLLQILDEGVLTDSTGLKVNFDNCIIILTANTGKTVGGIGFSENSSSLSYNEATKLLNVELADRVDEIIAFKPLGKAELCDIVTQRLEDFCQRMKEKGVFLSISEDFAQIVVDCTNTNSARSVVRNALRFAEEAVSELLLETEKGKVATLFMEKGRGIAKIKQNTY